MRQIATAQDGVALEITRITLFHGEGDDRSEGFGFIFEEDGIPVQSPTGDDKRFWPSAREARSAAWERFVARSRGVGITEYCSDNGGCGTLMWRTE